MSKGKDRESEHLKGRFKEACPFVSTFGSLLESNSSVTADDRADLSCNKIGVERIGS